VQGGCPRSQQAGGPSDRSIGSPYSPNGRVGVVRALANRAQACFALGAARSTQLVVEACPLLGSHWHARTRVYVRTHVQTCVRTYTHVRACIALGAARLVRTTARPGAAGRHLSLCLSDPAIHTHTHTHTHPAPTGQGLGGLGACKIYIYIYIYGPIGPIHRMGPLATPLYIYLYLYLCIYIYIYMRRRGDPKARI
jgi:hypothetical protein